MSAFHGPMAYDYDSVAPDHSKLHIVSGTAVQPGAWAGIVSIQDPQEPGTGHICGGSLISTEWVVTAAHCFINARNSNMWHVVTGATRLTQLGPEVQVRQIKQVRVHEHYTPGEQMNDIALLKLDQPVVCSHYVQLGCVPNTTLKVSELKTCYIAGWGSTTTREYSSVMGCEGEGYSSSADSSHPTLLYSPLAPMQADSGGPLVCKDNNAAFFWLIGVTSWGKGCERANQPGVYTSVQHFYDWILVQIDPQLDKRASRHSMTAINPPQKPKQTPTALDEFSSSPFSMQKLVEFFTQVHELLQVLRRKLAREAG
ncbi:acrosin-like [Parus major]|uniref:acrosin-like n=1 Tax=Parus major TaxID=9157 RepID=UPI001444747B|nr:acrosin-like [Parus major]